jgi:hypothetical protein
VPLWYGGGAAAAAEREEAAGSNLPQRFAALGYGSSCLAFVKAHRGFQYQMVLR